MLHNQILGDGPNPYKEDVIVSKTDINKEYPTDFFGDSPKNFIEEGGASRFCKDSGLLLCTKLLDGHKADYLHPIRNPVTRHAINYKDPVIKYPTFALDRDLEQHSQGSCKNKR